MFYTKYVAACIVAKSKRWLWEKGLSYTHYKVNVRFLSICLFIVLYSYVRETYDTNDPPMLKTLSGGVITQQQTHTAATPPAQSALQTGALLLDLPPLITKQGVTNKEDISRLSLDDLLGPISEKNRLGEQGITAQDDTNPSGKEWRAPVLKPTTFSTEVDYSDDFSSQSNEDQDTADNSPRYKLLFYVCFAGEVHGF